MKTKYIKFAVTLSAITASAVFGAESIALGEVKVLANKISENLEKIPQSISVISGVELEEKGIKNISELTQILPNTYATTGIHEGVTARGLNGSAFTSSNPVMIYINGVAQANRYGYYIPTTNIQRIEVLRGPSSTIYGKDSIGGVINIVLKEPSEELSGSIASEFGSYRYFTGMFDASGAIIQDTLYLGLNGSASKDGGWITNELKGEKANDKKDHNFGLNLKFTPTDKLAMKLFFDTYRKRHNGNDGIMIPYAKFNSIKREDVKHAEFLSDTYSIEKSNSLALNLTYDFDKFDFTSVTALKNTKQRGNFDMSFGGKDFKNYLGFNAFSDIRIKDISQELRVGSKEGQDTKWIGGIYFENETIDKKRVGQQLPPMPPFLPNANESDAPSKTHEKTMSAFGQIGYLITPKLEATLGGRYQRIKKDVIVRSYSYPIGGAKGAPFVFEDERTFNSFLPKFALSYAFTEALSAYASYSKGYLSGGFNLFAAGGEKEDNRFDSQTSDNYEIGIKGAYENFRFSAAAFYMDIKDTHIYFVDPANPNDIKTGNADKAVSKGLEFESTARLSKQIDLNFAASLLKTKYGNYPNLDGTNAKGNRIEKNPNYKFTTGLSYHAPFGLYARLDTNLVGKTYFNPQNTLMQKSYFTADTKIGYVKGNFDIYAYVRNLTDKQYFSNVFDRGYGLLVAYDKGRVFGLGVRYSF